MQKKKKNQLIDLEIETKPLSIAWFWIVLVCVHMVNMISKHTYDILALCQN